MAINVVHTKPEFIDDRGGITRIIDQDKFSIRAVLRITSKAGFVRSNHYHKKDHHYLFVESGKCEYSEKLVNDSDAKLETVVLIPGDLSLSNPGIINKRLSEGF